MRQVAIRVENLSKQYRIGVGRGPAGSRSLRETVADTITAPLRGLGRARAAAAQETTLWALKDVSFDIQPGEVVGVIGRNGSGKSTLLKILSRITAPQSGRILLNGRVGSLLEVGTGFHPELTGRENIYLNGSILGMHRWEINRQFDAIVDFSGIERFLDTPVKRYSSGMYVRLAFAVAAHLNPEIMLVDEVLAVGDAEFQKKCLGKMQDVAHAGRTVLFVSHNMAAVRQLCTSGVLLAGGRLVARDAIEKVLQEYLSQRSGPRLSGGVNENGVELLDLTLRDARTGLVTELPVFNEDYELTLRFRAHQSLPNAALVVRIYDEMETLVSSIGSPEEDIDPARLDGLIEATFSLPRLPLFPGKYSVSILVARDNDWPAYLEAAEALTFEVQEARVGKAARAYDKRHGLVRICDSARFGRLPDGPLSADELLQQSRGVPREAVVPAGRGAEEGVR